MLTPGISQDALQRINELGRVQREKEFNRDNPVVAISAILKKQIQLFESKLNQDEDVMIMAASFGSAVLFYAHTIEFSQPNIIIFHGSDENGNDISLLQHCNQLNFLLQVGKREQPEQPKRQIGFVIND